VDVEKLGAFYLGTSVGEERGPLLYDSKDLTTHGVCVGMTGSGKTGLCLALLEEAAIDGVPAIAIDLKGDLGNLLLTFPALAPADFLPWVDDGEAQRHGHTREAHAAFLAEQWRAGLAESGQSPERIARFRDAVDVALFTPGSAAGRPLSLLRSLAAPPPALDAEALRERIGTAAASLLALLDVDADPLQSREHVLLSQLLAHAWGAGRSLDLGELVRAILDPPVVRFGVLDVEAFFPKKERSAFALRMNNLLASPAFAGWLEGEPLAIERLLWTPAGKPRLSILSLSHLGDAERMFFVTLLLGELLAWMRQQSGTGSLRALLFMDEVFGFFPPVKMPPSKAPMLTLLKQARAFGLGVVLATQNPVDLDYKGLSNCGTWWLGRLQTERDLERVLDGLEGVGGLDRATLARRLAGLEKRCFFMHDVHRTAPMVFRTRSTLSYLRGPLSRAEVRRLTEAQAPDATPTGVGALGGSPALAAAPVDPAQERPALDPEIEQVFLAAEPDALFRAALLATVAIHYVHPAAELDVWVEPTLIVPLPPGRAPVPWTEATWHRTAELRLGACPPGARFAPLARPDITPKGLAALGKQLALHLFKNESLPLFHCKPLALWSRYGEGRADLAARAQLALREARDREVEKLRARHAPKVAELGERMRKASQRVERQSTQQTYQGFDTAVSAMGALFGGRSMFTAARGVGRTARQRGEVARAEEDLATVEERMRALEAEFAAASAAIQAQPLELPVDEKRIRPRKGDVSVARLALVWLPTA
jgi:hypothetical protein